MLVGSFALPNSSTRLWRHAASHMLLYAAFVVSVAAYNCTGNIVEFNLGYIGNFMANETFQPFGDGDSDSLVSLRFVDLDFQSTYNSNIPWGPSMLWPGTKPNPCLRVRPILLMASQRFPNSAIASQSLSIWSYGNDTVDGLMHSDWVDAEVAAHADANRRAIISFKEEPQFELQPTKYPYAFRYSASSIKKAKVYYEYYNFFGLRCVHYVYSQHSKIMDTFSFFLSHWERNQPNGKLLSYNIPSENATWRQSVIGRFLVTIQDSPMRFVVLDIDPDGTFEFAPGCMNDYAVCTTQLFITYGVWAPTFQILTNVETIVALDSIANAYDLFYNSSIHYAAPANIQTEAYNDRMARLVLDQAIRLSAMDFAEMRDRYGIRQWHEQYLSVWDTFFQPMILRNDFLKPIPSGTSLRTELLYRIYVFDVAAYFISAWNDIMNGAQITHKSQVTVEMLGQALSNTTPPYTVVGGTAAYKMPFPSKTPNFEIGVYQFLNRTTRLPEPVCCQDQFKNSDGVVISTRKTPRWATGEVSSIPSASLAKCSPGMYSTDGLCEWCREGRYSNTIDATQCGLCSRGKYAKERSMKCNDCEEGKVASELQMGKCDNCRRGMYAASKGMSSCDLCETGRYSSVVKATTCFSCGGDLTTAALGSHMPDDCVCPKFTFSSDFKQASVNQSMTTSCEECMKGLQCEEGWPDSWNAKGSLVSQVKSGYFVLNSAPFSVYKCCPGENCDNECPGGPPENCIVGREGLLCDRCVNQGYYISGKECKECPAYLKLILLICAAASCAFCIAGYYATNGALTVNADNPLAFFLFLGLVVTAAQVFGVIKDLSIPWPDAFSSFFSSSSSAFTLDANSVSIECAVGSNVTIMYLCQVLIPHVLLIEICLVAQLSKLLAVSFGNPAKAWETDKTMNVAGQLMQALFIAFCVIAMKPLQCFDHPNKKQSVLAFPRVLCYEGGIHTELIILSGCICASFLLPFVAWCVYGCVAAPRESSIGNALFLKRYRFLLYRFRPDCWWWGLCFILRQTLLALATVIPADNPHAQLLYTGGTLTVYSIFASRFWPWICHELSIVDVGSMLILLLLMLAAAQYLPEPDPNKGRFGLLVCMSLTFIALLARYSIILMMSVCARGIFAEFGTEKPNRIRVCELWLNWLAHAKNLSNKDIVEIVCKMNGFDRRSLFDLITLWNAATASKEGRVEKSGKEYKLRLRGLPSKTKITEKKSNEVIAQWKHDMSDKLESRNVENECEHNVGFPRSFRVIASSGVALLLNTKKEGINHYPL